MLALAYSSLFLYQLRPDQHLCSPVFNRLLLTSDRGSWGTGTIRSLGPHCCLHFVSLTEEGVWYESGASFMYNQLTRLPAPWHILIEESFNPTNQLIPAASSARFVKRMIEDMGSTYSSPGGVSISVRQTDIASTSSGTLSST